MPDMFRCWTAKCIGNLFLPAYDLRTARIYLGPAICQRKHLETADTQSRGWYTSEKVLHEQSRSDRTTD